MEREREREKDFHLSKSGLFGDMGFQLGAVNKMTQSVTPEVVYKVNCQSQNMFSQTVCPGPAYNQSNLNRFTFQTA